MKRSNRVPDGYKAAGVDVAEAEAGLRNIIARITATWPQAGLGPDSVLWCGVPLQSAAEHCSESEIRSPLRGAHLGCPWSRDYNSLEPVVAYR